jgi:radical SAM superfamily enzyme YgiQ (UPF0313 family)
MSAFEEPRLFRPPAEADSFILRIAYGCPSNTCAFCGMYKGVPYQELPPERVAEQIQIAARTTPGARRIFLADGDVMHLPFPRLKKILQQLHEAFPRLARINTYANGRSILSKTEPELRELHKLKLNTLYMGLESGDQLTLKRMLKEDTAEEMVRAGIQAQNAGLRMSVMILLGLGGVERSATHAEATAAALNQMQPRLLSVLRVIPIANALLYRWCQNGDFQMLTEYQAVAELRRIVAGLQLRGTVFRANHASNLVPLEGRLPHDQEQILADLDQILAGNKLDRNSPGPMPMWL